MPADEATTEAVTAVLKAFNAAYARGDVEALGALMLDSPDLVMIGTAADEVRRGPAEARRQFERDIAQSQARTLSADWVSVSGSGGVAWLASGLTVAVTAGGQALSFPIRLTMVLVRGVDEAWHVAQAHVSVADQSTPEGSSYPDTAW